MERRKFLKLLTFSSIIAGSGLVLLRDILFDVDDVDVYNRLPTELKVLFDPEFRYAYPDLSLDMLLIEMTRSGIFKNGEYFLDRLNTVHDFNQLEAYNGFYYTRPEMLIYTFVARSYYLAHANQTVHAELVQLNAVDLIGADFKRLKTRTNEVKECVAECSRDANCIAFTFAQASHLDPSKKGHCWLKKEGFKYQRSPHYISGIKLVQ